MHTPPYNNNDVRGGFDGSGNSLVYHPDHYNSAVAGFILVNGVVTFATLGSGEVVGLGVESLAFGNANRAFWMGKIPAQAGSMAKTMGFHTLEQSNMGRLSVQISKIVPEQYKMKFWYNVSSRYASGAQGVAPVFYNARTGVATGQVFRNSELPQLISNGISREYWAVW